MPSSVQTSDDQPPANPEPKDQKLGDQKPEHQKPDDQKPDDQKPDTVIRAEELHQLYAGADGKLDDIEKLMLKYDEDRSGHFCISEVKSIIRDLEQHKQNSKHLGRALIGTVGIGLLVLAAMFALMILSIEATKENRTKGNELVTNSGESVRVASVEALNGVFDLPYVSVEHLQYMTKVSFNVALDSSAAVSSATFQLGGFLKATDQKDDEQVLHIFTTTGAEITIGPGKTGRVVTSSGKSMRILDDSVGRRLAETAWLDCNDKSSCEPRAAPEGRRLRRGSGGFLAATGSFTLGGFVF